MPANPRIESPTPNFLVELVEALSDRQGQIELRLEHLALRFPMMRESVELNGQVSLSLHLRDLSDKEKSARSAREIRLLEP